MCTPKQIEHLRSIAQKGGKALVAKRGAEYMSSIAQKGGRALVEKYGNAYMRQIGTSGALAFHTKYTLIPVELSQFAIIDRLSGKTVGFLSGEAFARHWAGGIKDESIPF